MANTEENNFSRMLDAMQLYRLEPIEPAHWQQDNAEALKYLDKRAEEDGLVSDEYRIF